VTCAFSKKKAHSRSIASEPLPIWNKKLEGLEFLLLEKLKISYEDMYFEKAHSLSVAPKPLVSWNKKLEGLKFLLLEKLKILSENMYPATPEHISRFFYTRRTRL
jgi:hypothetical protein